MEFNERIFSARKAKGYSQEDLADIVNVSRQAVSKWETGDAMPDMEKCIALCEALDLSAEYLLLGKEIPTIQPAPKKPLRWFGVSLLAVLCLGAGFLTGHFAFPPAAAPQETPEPIVQTVVVEKEVIKEVAKDCPVADVLYSQKNGYGEVRILPAVVEDNMQIQIIYENKNVTAQRKTVTCTFDGTYFKGSIPLNNAEYHYYITAVICGEKTKQLPILDVSGDAYHWSARPLWK